MKTNEILRNETGRKTNTNLPYVPANNGIAKSHHI